MSRRRSTPALATQRRTWNMTGAWTTTGPRANATFGMLGLLAWAAAVWAPEAGGQTPDRPLAGQGFWGVPAAMPRAAVASPGHVSQAAHDVWAATRDQPSPHDWPAPQEWASEGAVYHGSLSQGVPLPSAAAGLTWQPPYPEGYAGPGGPLAGAVPQGISGSWPSGSRHWVRHFGYRRAYTQWTLK